MPYVCDVHDVHYRKAVKRQHPAQDIFKDVGAQVSDMGVIVNRRAAGVHPGPWSSSAAQNHASCAYRYHRDEETSVYSPGR